MRFPKLQRPDGAMLTHRAAAVDEQRTGRSAEDYNLRRVVS